MNEQIMNGFEVACIDANAYENTVLMPEFISNDISSGKKVLTSIQKELINCDSFSISVAFITTSGITPLKQTLLDLKERNIKGKIITTDYLNFTEPRILKELQKFDNIEVRMHRVKENNTGFHTKGYLFNKADIYTFIIGSSNLTQKALTVNKEWNSKLVSLKNGAYAKVILDEFDSIWAASTPIANCIDEYEKDYNEYKKTREVVVRDNTNIKPNSMQKQFVDNVTKLIANNQKRALLVSSTASGKTYAAAFAMKKFNPDKALFLVHREQIAKRALFSFRNIFKGNKTYGMISGNHKDFNKDYIFATMQTMSKQDIYNNFKPDHFDYIIIDEAHRIGSNSYQKLLNYFKPKFCLGMTASPERSDDFDVFKMFDNNIATEIRLQDALKLNLITPFHYFGISELKLNDDEIDYRDFRYLICEERVLRIIEKLEYYGYSGDRVKGLIFCSTNKEAKELSNKFNYFGYKTISLSGNDTQEKRLEEIDRLTSDDENDYLDYIFSVDIFNEGIDIPEINQVVLLRPTESPIIFVQQLGRGLRKNLEKEFVTIIDFIGNYDTNYMIPIALSGDKSYNKDNLRKFLIHDRKLLPGSSTINLDKIALSKILTSIDTARFNDIKFIKESYLNLRQRLNKIPKMIDFIDNGDLDLQRVFDNKNLKSYHNFLMKYEKEYNIELTTLESLYIEFISVKLANAKRIHELIMIEMLLNNNFSLNSYKEELTKHNIKFNDNLKDNLRNIMTNNFNTGSSKKTYEKVIFINNDFTIHNDFKNMLNNNNFNYILSDLLQYCFKTYELKYQDNYKDTSFNLQKKYTYEDVCRLLNWEKSIVPLNIGGYKYDKKTNTFPVFINYDKEETIKDTINYHDRFINPSTLIAISKSNRTINSDEIKKIYDYSNNGIKIELFVRKNKDDSTSKEFYYLGSIIPILKPHQIKMKNTNENAVEITYKLENPVSNDLYDYIVKDE